MQIALLAPGFGFVSFVLLVASVSPTSLADDAVVMPKPVMQVLAQSCIQCHGADYSEGDIELDSLTKLDVDARLDLLNRIQEQLFLRRMPPEDAEQLSADTHQRLARWVKQELDKHDASKLESKLQKPEYGNYIDHEKLFSGEYSDLPGFTYDRRWLISEFIFDAKMQRIVANRTVANWQGKRVDVMGGHKVPNLSLANPFLLPDKSGVRYYAIDDLNGGHLSAMLSNALKTSEFITDTLVKDTRKKNYLPKVREVFALQDQHEATLVSRRQFLKQSISTICEKIYGDKNNDLLPEFASTELNEKKEFSAEDTKKDKRLPVPVARKNLEKSGGWSDFEQVVLSPANKSKSDEEIIKICERKWFYHGDYKRDIQGRLSLLRDYTADFRTNIAEDKRAKLIEYQPLDEAEMVVICVAIQKHRKQGDFYNEIIEKCLADWEQQFNQDRIDAGPPADELYAELIEELFVHFLERRPAVDEAEEYLNLIKGYSAKLGRRKSVQKLIQTLLLTSEFAYRSEFGVGEPDEHGRRMMSPRDASYALAYALTDQSPDAELVAAVADERLDTREDYHREVTRMLKKRDVYYQIDKHLADRWREDNVTNMPVREVRFFREFFGYPKSLMIFKDEKRFGGDRLENATSRLLAEADRMVMHILENDQNVIEQLLGTEEFIVYHDGNTERMQARSDEIKRIYEFFKDKDWENFQMEDLTQTHADFLRTVNMRMIDPDKPEGRTRQGNMLQLFKKSMRSITNRMDDGQQQPAPFDLYRGYGNDFMPGYNVGKFWNYDLDQWDYSTVQPAPVPNRKGMLTHPAWLIAHAQNTETDPVIRGKWIREKLLAGTIPDVPISVDATVPEDHTKTLRERVGSVTENYYCWKCHQHMNPLGYAFEEFDDFGRFRREESLEYPDKLIEPGPEQHGDHLVDMRDLYQTLPVDSTGNLSGTGDESLDGDVTGAVDLTTRLAKSRRVRQSIIRHAFRYFMGRNETLSDSKTLIDAEQAYVANHGSFDAVIVSLLTSDSFIYRKPIGE